MSDQKNFDKFLRGEWFPDDWKSEWRKDFEAYMEEQEKRPKVKDVPVYKVVKPKTRTIYKRVEKLPCPLCEKLMNKNLIGLCRGCGRKWAAFINQKCVRVCKECPKTLQGSAVRGLCTRHSELIRKRDWKRRKTAMKRELAVAA